MVIGAGKKSEGERGDSATEAGLFHESAYGCNCCQHGGDCEVSHDAGERAKKMKWKRFLVEILFPPECPVDKTKALGEQFMERHRESRKLLKLQDDRSEDILEQFAKGDF